MKKLLSVDEAIEISSQLRRQGKRIVLAGGCFDILHAGHIVFLKKSKAQGDILMVLLEDDEKIKERKGDNRPINAQRDRANILAALPTVDYVIMLPYMKDDTTYEQLVSQLKPAIIPMTKPDRYAKQKETFAKHVGGKTVYVTGYIEKHSTSKLIKNLS